MRYCQSPLTLHINANSERTSIVFAFSTTIHDKMPHPFLAILTPLFLAASTSALPQAPSPTPIANLTWAGKVAAMKSYILTQPTSTKNAGFWSGPTYQVNFDDGDCHQIRIYNWDCSHDIPYTPVGIAKWIDDIGIGGYDWQHWPYSQYYEYGNYRNPEDGWDYFLVARLTYAACGNRGPQSSCGYVMCTKPDGSGLDLVDIPKGKEPYVDTANARDRVCDWYKG